MPVRPSFRCVRCGARYPRAAARCLACGMPLPRHDTEGASWFSPAVPPEGCGNLASEARIHLESSPTGRHVSVMSKLGVRAGERMPFSTLQGNWFSVTIEDIAHRP